MLWDRHSWEQIRQNGLKMDRKKNNCNSHFGILNFVGSLKLKISKDVFIVDCEIQLLNTHREE